MKSNFLLILGLCVVMLAVVFYAGMKAAANHADEVAALRQDVAALRAEVEKINEAHEADGRRNRAQNADGWNGTQGAGPGPAEIMARLEKIGAQQEAAQRALSSNLVDITVELGSDAWARGDFKKAMKLLKPLAESGQPIAEHRVGVMYMLGQGVDKDPAEAIKWFSKAADQGQGESQHSLGLRYLWGDGVDKDPQAAANWFIAAANQGIPDSATWLADMYWNGSGVQADPVEAYKWMLLSGDKFNINHRGNVTMDQFAAQLTPQQLTEAQQRAKAFVPQRTGPEDF